MVFEHRFRLRFADVDAGGRMFFARLFDHAHAAYEDLLDSLGADLSQLIESGGALPLAQAQADYLRPMALGEDVVVVVEVARIGRRSFTLAYAFLDSRGELRARARTIHVWVPPPTDVETSLPAEIRRGLVGLAEASAPRASRSAP